MLKQAMRQWPSLLAKQKKWSVVFEQVLPDTQGVLSELSHHTQLPDRATKQKWSGMLKKKFKVGPLSQS